MRTLQVALAERSYSIHIGSGLLAQHPAYGEFARRKLKVVTDDNVAAHHLRPLLAALGLTPNDALVLPAGEQHKTLATVERIVDWLLGGNVGRDGCLVALGGGVVGDLTGFAAAIYQRGIDFVQAPTTLLAQVDSSVGGKTGVNHARGKNMIGAFHQPRLVLTDLATLRTLPQRELQAGLAEVVKYGLLGDVQFVGWLEKSMDKLLALDANTLVKAVEDCCSMKARIVGEDEREAGPRALLNLGHTFGHAIETHTGYGQWLHGEAVAVGLCMAADLSARLGWITPAAAERASALVAAAGLPVKVPSGMTPARFLELMGHDKKVQGGRLRLVLLKALGNAVVSADFDPAKLQETLALSLREPGMNLAPYAARDETSRGRRYPEDKPNNRTEYQRDRDRIIHSSAFRRLRSKTQVFVNHEGDLFRTRLTHSLEVAQIARTVARNLALNEELVEAISLAHDLGHTPFGHAGQDALNGCMRGHGGFEHNAQSLRVVDELEDKYAQFRGLNLTFETREGILKHCSLRRARELGDIGERFLKKQQSGLEAQLANVADEVAYSNHDIDDGLRAGLLTFAQLADVPLVARHLQVVRKTYRQITEKQLRHETVRRIINALVTDLTEHTRELLQRAAPRDIEAVRSRAKALVSFSAPVRAEAIELKRFLFEHLYRHHRVYRMSRKAQDVIAKLFAAFMDDPRLLPPEHWEAATLAEKTQGKRGRALTVADFIAGMTDRYAIDEHERLFDPRRLR